MKQSQGVILASFSIIIFALIFVSRFADFRKYWESREDVRRDNLAVSTNGVGELKEDPCFLYENINRTQLVYTKLIKVLETISLPKKMPVKTLGNNCQEHTFIPGTTSNRMKTELNEITNVILCKINKITGFNFVIVYYDVIKVITDCNANRNFFYNVFVQDTNEAIQIRLFINVIKYIKEASRPRGEAITCATATTPGMDTYEIGYPKPDQLLPLPTEVIVSGRDVLSQRGINRLEIPPILGELVINSVQIYNTNAVLGADGKCLMEKVCGDLPDTTLDNSEINQPTTPFQDPACIANKWQTLYDEPKNLKAWPCADPSPFWNDKGIPCPSACCDTQITGIRSSTTQYPLVPSYWPTLATVPRNSGPNYWMFNLTRGDVATEGAAFTN